MVGISTWRSDLIPGVFCPKIGVVYARLPSRTVSYNRSAVTSHDCIQRLPRKMPGRRITQLSLGGRAVKCASSVERKYQYSVNDNEEPFLIYAMKEFIRSIKSVLVFLVEQPGQLKYIEWPGFQSTLKTATLALVLVGIFVIALSSIDSALSYLLTLFLRRPA